MIVEPGELNGVLAGDSGDLNEFSRRQAKDERATGLPACAWPVLRHDDFVRSIAVQVDALECDRGRWFVAKARIIQRIAARENAVTALLLRTKP